MLAATNARPKKLFSFRLLPFTLPSLIHKPPFLTPDYAFELCFPTFPLPKCSSEEYPFDHKVDGTHFLYLLAALLVSNIFMAALAI